MKHNFGFNTWCAILIFSFTNCYVVAQNVSINQVKQFIKNSEIENRKRDNYSQAKCQLATFNKDSSFYLGDTIMFYSSRYTAFENDSGCTLIIWMLGKQGDYSYFDFNRCDEPPSITVAAFDMNKVYKYRVSKVNSEVLLELYNYKTKVETYKVISIVDHTTKNGLEFYQCINLVRLAKAVPPPRPSMIK